MLIKEQVNKITAKDGYTRPEHLLPFATKIKTELTSLALMPVLGDCDIV